MPLEPSGRGYQSDHWPPGGSEGEMRRWLKPSSLERMPTPLKHCCISYLQEISTMPELKGQSQAVEGLIASVVELEVGLHLEQGSEDPVGSTESMPAGRSGPDHGGASVASDGTSYRTATFKFHPVF